jgi:hypothetical protein
MSDEFKEWLEKCPVNYYLIQEFPDGKVGYVFLPEGATTSDMGHLFPPSVGDTSPNS